MRNTVFTLLAVAASACPSGAEPVQSNSYVQRKISVADFDKVEITGPFKVAIFVAGKPADVVLQGPPALLADTIAEVSDGTLKIRYREGATWSWNPGSGVNVSVVATQLRSARAVGAATVEIDQFGQTRGKSFSAATTGSGSITVRGLDSEQVQLATGGAGGIIAEGSAGAGTYAVGGAGSIDAKRLRVKSASIAIGGAGSIYADVARTAVITVDGGGGVDVVGGATCVKPLARAAQVECR